MGDSVSRPNFMATKLVPQIRMTSSARAQSPRLRCCAVMPRPRCSGACNGQEQRPAAPARNRKKAWRAMGKKKRGGSHPPPAFVPPQPVRCRAARSEEHTSELQSQSNLVCRLLLEKKKRTECKAPSQAQL